MAKTGTNGQPGTAEGAAIGRALHTLHAESPMFRDDWAVHLISVEKRAEVLAATDEQSYQQIPGFDSRPILAVGMGCLRYAEDEIERSINRGMHQYLVLGAGLDSFCLRRADLAGQVTVFEIDHPDTQTLKRERIATAIDQGISPATLPVFIAVDFEQDSLHEKILASAFKPELPTIVSWMNTLPYLTEAATAATVKELTQLLAPGSRLLLNYSADVPFNEEQVAYITTLMSVVEDLGEPQISRWVPEAFADLLANHGFRIVEHATEEDLTARYFNKRADGLKPGVPLRVLIAELTA